MSHKSAAAGAGAGVPVPLIAQSLCRQTLSRASYRTRRQDVAMSAGAVAPEAAAPGPSSAAGGQAEMLMPAQLTWPSRSHGCGTLRDSDAGTTITICGWVDRNRDMGGVQFFDMRDHTGLLQVRKARRNDC